MQRSQSAPQPIEALFKVTPLGPTKTPATPTKEIAPTRVKLIRSKSYAVDQSSHSSLLTSPWATREDPFSLGGFFSDRIALDEEKQWGWIRGETQEREFAGSSLHTEENLGRLEDDQAEKTINAEDKYGLLSLGSMFAGTTAYPDDRLYSPYSEGEAIDHDSLYLALCSRRQASTHAPPTQPNSRSGELFFPTKADEDEVAPTSSWGPSAIFSRDATHPSNIHSPPQPPSASSAPHSPITAAPPSVISGSDPNVSIQSILANSRSETPQNGQLPAWSIQAPAIHNVHQHGPMTARSMKRKLDDTESDDPHHKIRRVVRDHVSNDPARVMPMTTVICLHAAVAQKSYGTEKRFLCPPPVVHVEGPVWQMRSQTLSMAVISETGERSFEQKAPLDNSMTASFKFLHVTGTQKAKSFQLSLDISEPTPASLASPENDTGPIGRSWASFDSAPVTIISKPSKKTAKTRNISSCILAGGPVSLFNRINSQTVRTKYMTIDHTQLCASNIAWSAFNVNVVRRPTDAPALGGPQPVQYGCEIILSDTLSQISTSPLVIRKVDKGRVSPEDGGPVSQMQKIALQRVNPDGSRHYLSAAGPVPGGITPGVVVPPAPGMSSQAGTHPLLFQAPRVREETKDGQLVLLDEVDDYLCWTIVGISKFQYTFFDAFGQNNTIPDVPITPFPTLFTAPVYRPANNTIELTVSNFFYDDPKTRAQTPLDVYLGNIGPLRQRVYQASPPGPLTNISPFVQSLTGDSGPGGPGNPGPSQYMPSGPLHTIVVVEMPPLADVIKALEEDANASKENGPQSGQHSPHEPSGSQHPLHGEVSPPSIAGHSLPLLFIRASDGVGYHSGRTIACENVFQSMDLMGSGPNQQSASIDTGWLAAAQAAAAADGGLHGWTLRVIQPGSRKMVFSDGIRSQLEWNSALSTTNAPLPTEETKYLRKTGIIATIGPKTNSVEKLAELRRAGVNIVRMNFSHGEYAYHQSVIDNTRAMVKADPNGRPVAIALDTKGPEIRTGLTVNGEDWKVPAGHEMFVTTEEKYAQACDDKYMYVDYKNLPKVTAPGKLIYVDDGILSLLVLSIDGPNVRVRVLNNGNISSRKGVNLPKTDVDLPALSEKDKKDLQFGVKNGVDMIFASFIRRADDVRSIREVLGPEGANIKIIVKIENEQGVENFDEILKETDGVMVARGDLGIEIPASQVFLAQKMMISKCNVAGKSVIVATQMLEVNPRPTRAEVSDVANAVLDGADCVMLSGETAKGAYPIQSVLMMAETCLLAEYAICHPPLYDEIRALQARPTQTAETLAIAAVAAASEQTASAILVLSTSGNTARLISKYRPSVPIITVTRNEQTSRQIHLHRGVYPFWYPEPRGIEQHQWQTDVDNRIRFGLRNALALNLIKPGSTIVAVQGWKGGLGHTNTLRILSVPTDAADLAMQPLGSKE
ncbi:hypothetical protein HWV62_42388 [Athelia sp. TMB]|nr:hypothetical protein HWV62_42388 [Athelia sp. TMB]